MAERFNLTAQLQLQAPTNTRQIADQIRKQLAPVGAVDVQLKADSRALRGASDQLNQLNKATKSTNKSVGELNRTIAESARRFSVITVATGTLLGFVNSLKNSTKAAIEFEREIVKIQQVTGKSATQLKALTTEVTRLSTSLGASSADLLNVSRILLQTGLSADKTRKALDVLAKTSLGATFDSIQDTTEGAIALLRQFGGQARRAGKEIEFLEKSLDAINSVSKNFAVESGDLVTAIRRVGGVFAAAGGEVNELIALFTSVRATTRESAETIATGLRTIFTRIQRGDTVNQLKELGIQLQDAQGNFVGAFEAFKRLSQGLSALDPKSFRFSEIVEQLGGFRQVGKVIPLIQQFTTAQQALAVAQASTGSVAKDAQTAQQSLAVQIQKTREQFDALIRKFADSTTFRSIANFSLELAQSLIKVTEALEPLLPLLTSLLALKVGRGLGAGFGALANFGRGSGGAPVSRFARGGMVPGTGNTDSVPAMLTPGEFVIRKSSVKKLGVSNLAAMNTGGYAKYSGGTSRRGASKKDIKPENPLESWQKSKETQLAHIGSQRALTDLQIKNILTNIDSGRATGAALSNAAKGVLGTKSLSKLSSKQISEVKKQLKPVSTTPLLMSVPTRTNQALKSTGTGSVKNGLANWISQNPTALVKQGRRSSISINAKDIASGNLDEFAKRVGSAVSTLPKKVVKDFDVKNVKDDIFGLLTPEKQKKILGVKDILFRTPGQARSQGRLEGKSRDVFRKFNLGGIVNANKVGAAILEADKGAKTDSIKVGINDVKPYIPGSGFKKDKAQKNFGKVTGFTGKSYTLTKQGLNQKTSDNFSNVLFNETAEGVNKSVQQLSNDLGLGSISLGNSNVLSDSLRKTGIVGALFESTLNTLQNRGKFSPEAANAPFDFPGGLSGKLADNYSNLPSSWIDAKSSFAEASAKSFKTKIAREISDEYVRSGDYDKALSGKGFASGGGIAGSDTVPAMLTPGEFVFSKQSADKIGRANLNRMNKQGVQGFANGGPVGFQGGGNVAARFQNISFGALGLTALASQFDLLSDSTRDLVSQTSGYIAGTTGAVAALSGLRESFTLSITAKKREAQASNEVTASKLKEAKKDQASNSKRSSSAGKTIAAALAIGSALQVVESKFRQAAEAADKELKGFAESAKKGGEINVKGIKESIKKASDARASAEKAAAAKTIATYTALGASIGGPFGGAIGAAIGLYQKANVLLDNNNDAKERELRAIEQSTLAYLRTIAAYAQAQEKLNEILNLPTATEDTKGRAKLETAGSIVERAQSGDVAKANQRLLEAANKTGETVEALSNLTDGGLRDAGLNVGVFRQDEKTIAETTKQLQTAVTLSGEELQRQFSNLDFGKTFEQATAASGDFSSALRLYQRSLVAQQNQAIANARLQRKTDEEINAIQQRFAAINDDVVVSLKRQFQVQSDAKIVAEAENKARLALIATIERQEKVSQKTNKIREESESNLVQARSSRSILSGETGGIGQSLGTFSLNVDQSFDDLKSDLDEFIATLSGSSKKLAEETAEAILFLNGKIKNSANKIDALSLLSKEDLQAKFGESLSGIPPEVFAEALDIDLGEISNVFGTKAADTISEVLKSAFADGELTPDEVGSIKGSLNALKEKSTELAVNLTNLSKAERNAFLTKKENIEAEEDARKKNIEILRKFNKSASQVNNTIAKIRGVDSTSLQISQARADAQRLLNANVQGRGGVGLRAGDVQGLARAKRLALAETEQINTKIKSIGVDKLSEQQSSDFSARLKILSAVVNDVNAEFDRLSDRSLQLAKIQENFARQQKSNKQAFEVIGDFVVGDQKVRNDLNSAARGILLAVNTGTLQNQTGEQRSATVGLLDRLSDVFIGNTGLTGKDIKQELIFRDAVRLGLPPEIAKELAFSNSIEEQSLKELQKQTSALETLAALRFLGLASGGSVPSQGGGASSIFKPKGTDTVPAMLTPGEFVIKKPAVNKVGVDTLAAINSGKSPVYADGGGLIQRGFVQNSFNRAMGLADRKDFRAIKRESGVDGISYSRFRVAQQKGGAVSYLDDRIGVKDTISRVESALSVLTALQKIGAISLSKEFGRVRMKWRDNPDTKTRLDATIGDLKSLVGEGRESGLNFVDQSLIRYTGGGFTLQKDIIDLIDAYNMGEGYREEIEQKREPEGRELANRRARQSPAQRARQRQRRARRSPPEDYVPNPVYTASPGPPDAVPETLTIEELEALSAQAAADLQAQRQAALDKPLTQVRTSQSEENLISKQLVYSTQKSDPFGDGTGLPERTTGFAGLPKPVKQRVERENRAGITLEQRMAEIKNRDPNQRGKIPAFDPEANRKYIENYDVSPETKERFASAKAAATSAREEAAAFSKKRVTKDGIVYRYNTDGSLSPVESLGSYSENLAKRNAERKELRRKAFAEEATRRGVPLTGAALNEAFEAFDAANKGTGPIETRDLGVAAGSPQGRKDRSFKKFLADEKERVQQRNRDRGIGTRKLRPIDEYLSRYVAQGLFATGLFGRNLDDLNLPELGAVSETERATALGSIVFDALTLPIAFPKAAFGNVIGGLFKGGQQALRGGFDFGTKVAGGGFNAAANLFNRGGGLLQRLKDAKLNFDFGGLGGKSGSFLGRGPKSSLMRDADAALSQIAAKQGAVQVAEETAKETTRAGFKLLNGKIVLEGAEEGFPSASKAAARAVSDNNLSPQAPIQKATDLFKQSDDISLNAGGLRPLPQSIRESRPFLNTPTPGQLGRADLSDFIGGNNIPINAAGTSLQSLVLNPNFQSLRYIQRLGKDGLTRIVDTVTGRFVSRNNLPDDFIAPLWNLMSIPKAKGGGVPGGNDRVPAMLTPGEFVMSPEAVNKYGVGYMKNLNRGRVPGFRRGGIVGRGNVRYRANGSSNAESAGGGAVFSFDTSGIESVLETFNTDFAATLNSVVNEFSSLTSAMTKLSNTFSGDLSMKHTFSGDMTMAFNIGNLAELQQTIARAMTPTIVEQIKLTLAEMNKSLKI